MEEAARRLGVQLIKQYPAQEQAELKVRAQRFLGRGLVGS